MMEFSNEESKWAWVAGVIEGEGCLNITYDRSKYLNSQFVIVNNSRGLLQEVQRIVGGKIYKRKDYEGRNWARAHLLFVLKNKQKLAVLPEIIPFLVTKKRQAKLMIEFLNLRANGRKIIDTPRLLEIYQEMRKLNYRGRPSNRVEGGEVDG